MSELSIWLIAHLEADSALDAPEWRKYEMFLECWRKLKTCVTFVPSQYAANRLASIFKISAPKLPKSNPVRSFGAN